MGNFEERQRGSAAALSLYGWASTSAGGRLAGSRLFEEIVFRGILLDSLRAEAGTSVAVFGTSALFGFAHMHGYPPGAAGAVLAGCFGLLLAGLRLWTDGLALCVLVHIAADATIFSILWRSGVLGQD